MQSHRIHRKCRNHSNHSGGFSIVELLVVTAIIGLLLALIVPAVQSARDSARRLDCTNRMHNLGLALHAYESARSSYPSADPHCDQPDWASKFRGYKSWQLQLLPYLEQHAVHEKLMELPGIRRQAQHLMFELPILHCPADSVAIGMNYRFCSGRNCNSVAYLNSSQMARGMGLCSFSSSCRGRKASEITDGLSNTVVMSERLLSEVNSETYDRYRDIWFSGAMDLGFDPLSRTVDEVGSVCSAAPQTTRAFYNPFVGHNLVLHGHFNSIYNHVLTPNSKTPDCSMGSYGASGPDLLWGREFDLTVVTARSLHRDGSVNVLYADGSVRPVGKEIDVAVWRSLSTISDGD
jgi:prepilin-type processing-associated H-X9-DG protein